MAWNVEMLAVLRAMIGDLAATPTYTDDQLLTIILIAGQQSQQENSFNLFYATDIVKEKISPDPTIPPNRDEGWLWLTTLKACTIIGDSELKLAGSQAISIRDEGSAIDLRGTLEGKRHMATLFHKNYAEARWKWGLATRATGQAIFGPFAVISPALFGQAGGWQTYQARDRPLFN